jgi:hypothetical protein
MCVLIRRELDVLPYTIRYRIHCSRRFSGLGLRLHPDVAEGIVEARFYKLARLSPTAARSSATYHARLAGLRDYATQATQSTANCPHAFCYILCNDCRWCYVDHKHIGAVALQFARQVCGFILSCYLALTFANSLGVMQQFRLSRQEVCASHATMPLSIMIKPRKRSTSIFCCC